MNEQSFVTYYRVQGGKPPLASYKSVVIDENKRLQLDMKFASAKGKRAKDVFFGDTEFMQSFLKKRCKGYLIEKQKIMEYKNKFAEYVADDLNTPLALSVVWDALKNNPASADIYNLVVDFDRFLGLRLNEVKEETTNIPEEIIAIAEERKIARNNKDYATSDVLRDKITSLGYTILDKPKNEYELIKK